MPPRWLLVSDQCYGADSEVTNMRSGCETALDLAECVLRLQSERRGDACGISQRLPESLLRVSP
jgi:hypothetical protein